MAAEADLSRRTVLLHGGVYAASRIVSQGVTFLLLPLYAHLLGTEGVGIVEVLNVARAFLAILLVQGLDSACFRLRFEVESAEAVKRLESSIVTYLLVTVALALAAIALFGDLLGPILTPGMRFLPLGFFAAATAGATAFSLLLERKLQAEKRPLAFAVFSLARTSGVTLAIVVFVGLLGRGPGGKLEAEALGATIAALVALVLLRPRLRVYGPELRRALSYGLPMVPHGFAAMVNELFDRFVVSAMLGLGAVGVYSMGYRLTGVGMIVMVAINQAFAPLFIEGLRSVDRAVESGDSKGAETLRQRVASVGFFLVVAGCAAAQVVTAAVREVVELALTTDFIGAWRVVAPVAGGLVAWSWYATLSQSVTYRPSTIRVLPVITIATAAVNVGANYLLVPHFGIQGAAFATFVSNWVLALLTLRFATRYVPLPYRWSRWMLVTVWTFVSLAVLYAMDALLPAAGVRVAAKLGWVAASLCTTAFLSGIGVNALKSLWRQRGAG